MNGKNLKILILLLILIAGIMIWKTPKQNLQQVNQIQTPTVSISATNPGKNPSQNKTNIYQIPSGDGSVKLIQTVTTLADGSSSNLIKTVNVANNKETTILEKNLANGTSIMIPSNSWSPDNKQFFVEQISPDNTYYFVYKGDGSSFKQGQSYLDIGSFWANSKYTYSINTVTGWASDDLLVVYTSKQDGTKGPSFWFVISTHSFLQLSS
jgi:hypothetical protein